MRQHPPRQGHSTFVVRDHAGEFIALVIYGFAMSRCRAAIAAQWPGAEELVPDVPESESQSVFSPRARIDVVLRPGSSSASSNRPPAACTAGQPTTCPAL